MSGQEFRGTPARWFDDDAADLFLKVEGHDGESRGGRTAVELLGRLGGGGTDLCGSKLGTGTDGVNLCGSKLGSVADAVDPCGSKLGTTTDGVYLCGGAKPTGGAEWVFGTQVGGFDFLL